MTQHRFRHWTAANVPRTNKKNVFHLEIKGLSALDEFDKKPELERVRQNKRD